MSIIIEGMEIPKSKPICIVIDVAGQARQYDLNNEKFIDDELYEAVPVPPHGRLGDLDELKAKIKKEDSGYELNLFGDGMWTAFQSVYKCIDAAPTIIPATK